MSFIFKGISNIKYDIKLNANLMEWGGVFNVARYLTDSLRGPVLEPYGEAEGRVEDT